MKNQRIGVLCALASTALIASACGSSKTASSASTAAPATAATTTGAVTTAPATTAGASTTVPAATLGKQADGTYLGKGKFTIDPKKCPSDWNISQGITDKEIKLFSSMPKSGPLAGFGLIADGMNSYFKYINDQGGVAGHTISLDVKDDTYTADKTKANVDEALAAKQYAAMVTIIGTPNNLAIWDGTNKECMPQLLNGTGAAQWGDVDAHPWTTGMQLDYSSEATLWVEWIKKTFPSGAKVAAVTYNNDFGKSYSKGLKHSIQGTKFTLVDEELHDATAPNVTNQMTTLAATKADVLLIQTTGAFCTQAMAEVDKGSWKPTVIMSGTCGSLTQFFKPLVDQGLTGAGTHIIQTFKDVNDPAYANDDFVKLFKATTAKQGLDPKQSTYATGWIFGWYMTKILMDATKLNGGINKANIMIAARSLNGTAGKTCAIATPGSDCVMPLLLDGLTGKMSGLDDAYLTEGGQMAEYTVTDPKALGTFKKVGDLLNLEGKLKNYDTVAAITG